MTADKPRFDSKLQEAKDKARQPCQGFINLRCFSFVWPAGGWNFNDCNVSDVSVGPRRCVQLLAKEHLYKLISGGKGLKRKPEKAAESNAEEPGADDAVPATPKAKATAKGKARGKKAKKPTE